MRLRLLAFAAVLCVAALACEELPDRGIASSTPAAPDAERAGGAAQPESTTTRVALASTDLAVGRNRLAFGLIDANSGPVRGADAYVTTYYLGGGQREGPIQTARAVWRAWPVARAGLYTASFDFDRAGRWGIVATFVDDLGAERESTASIDVRRQSATPALGSAPPRSATKVAAASVDIRSITTDPDPDPDLYALTLAEGLDAGKPLVVAFSTPAYCTTATCGPQLDVIKGLLEDFYRDVNVIHVEVYDNPLEIDGDLARGRLAPAMVEWGLPTEPWTFIMDAQGKVAAKFEGFATRDELETALRETLR